MRSMEWVRNAGEWCFEEGGGRRTVGTEERGERGECEGKTCEGDGKRCAGNQKEVDGV